MWGVAVDTFALLASTLIGIQSGNLSIRVEKYPWNRLFLVRFSEVRVHCSQIGHCHLIEEEEEHSPSQDSTSSPTLFPLSSKIPNLPSQIPLHPVSSQIPPPTDSIWEEHFPYQPTIINQQQPQQRKPPHLAYNVLAPRDANAVHTQTYIQPTLQCETDEGPCGEDGFNCIPANI